MSTQTTAEIIVRQHKNGRWTWRYGKNIGTGGDTAQGALNGARDYLIECEGLDVMRETVAQVYPWNGTHYTVPGGKDAIECIPIAPANGPAKARSDAPYKVTTYGAKRRIPSDAELSAEVTLALIHHAYGGPDCTEFLEVLRRATAVDTANILVMGSAVESVLRNHPPLVPPPERYRKSAHQITDSTGTLGSWKWELRYGGAGALVDFGYQDTEAEALIEADKALSRRLLKDTQEASNRANAALRQGVNRHIEATQAATDALRDSKESQATVQKFDARPEPPKEGEPTYYVEGNPMPHIGIVGDLATSTTSPLQYWRMTESGWVAIGGIVPAKEETVMQPASTEHPLPKMVWSGEDEPDVTPAAKNLRLTLRRHAERHVAKLVVLEADYCMEEKKKRRRKLQWDMNEVIGKLHEIDELTPLWTLLNGEAGAV